MTTDIIKPKRQLLPVSDKTIKRLLKTQIQPKYKCGDLIRLYFGDITKQPIDELQYLSGVISGTNTSSVRVTYRIAFTDGKTWFTCNCFYPEEFIGSANENDSIPLIDDIHEVVFTHPVHQK